METVHILVVDDDPAIRRSLNRALKLEGYEVDTAVDGQTALDQLTTNTYNAIILDVLMPGIDGLEVCRRLRNVQDETPILMLTALDAVSDRVTGLDIGADDYLPKPFALAELLARVRALLRRRVNEGTDSAVMAFSDLSIDLGSYQVKRGNRALALTRTEFSLLELFLRNPKQVLPKEVICDRIWGWIDRSTSNSLEVYIGYLRKKLEEGGEPRLIHTIRGVGYILKET
ncbi:MAG: response regulator transcription factor [Actinobacteria bacterium]|nr:response regulator transcription factor [Actinomycetota bacterium]MCL6104653.1 response regulator transcription factor [Actinomycetota bacterium]